jgi:hypothetical protein
VPRYRSSGYEIFAGGSRDSPEAFHVRKGMVAGYRAGHPVLLAQVALFRNPGWLPSQQSTACDIAGGYIGC